MRFLLLMTTTLGTMGLAHGATAATCQADQLAITCTGPQSAPVTTAQNGVAVTVQAGAGLLSTDRATAALGLSGQNQTVTNAGDITNSDSRNNADAIAITGGNITITNTAGATINGGDRAIHATGGTGFVTVINQGTINARRQAIRTENDLSLPALIVDNSGTVESTEGRAIQGRGPGTQVYNSGTLYGWEEVIEARDAFTLHNTGLIETGRVTRDASGAVVSIERLADQDGVQFASGIAVNSGKIIGTDDGIDLDEGTIINFAGASIVSLGPDDLADKGAVDVDAAFDNGRDPLRPGGTVQIYNLGLMEGPRAITSAYDASLPDDHIDQSKQRVEIYNSGSLVGRGGIAVGLAPTQTGSLLELTGNSRITGDVVFGNGDDLLRIGTLTSGQIGDGLFDGLGGMNTVDLFGYDFSDVTGFALTDAGVYSMTLATASGNLAALFTNWNLFSFASGESLTTQQFADAFADPAPVPLPASAALLLAGLAGFGGLRLRRRA